MIKLIMVLVGFLVTYAVAYYRGMRQGYEDMNTILIAIETNHYKDLKKIPEKY